MEIISGNLIAIRICYRQSSIEKRKLENDIKSEASYRERNTLGMITDKTNPFIMNSLKILYNTLDWVTCLLDDNWNTYRGCRFVVDRFKCLLDE